MSIVMIDVSGRGRADEARGSSGVKSAEVSDVDKDQGQRLSLQRSPVRATQEGPGFSWSGGRRPRHCAFYTDAGDHYRLHWQRFGGSTYGGPASGILHGLRHDLFLGSLADWQLVIDGTLV